MSISQFSERYLTHKLLMPKAIVATIHLLLLLFCLFWLLLLVLVADVLSFFRCYFIVVDLVRIFLFCIKCYAPSEYSTVTGIKDSVNIMLLFNVVPITCFK